MATRRQPWPARLPAWGGLSLLPLLALACDFHPSEQNWTDQLQADGPCWRVDLSDGLDDQSTAELHDLFSCLDKTGGMASLRGVDAAFEATDRDGRPVGLSLATMVNALPGLDLDLFALLDPAIAALEQREELLDPMLELSIELLYGRRYELVVGEVDLTDGEELAQGLVMPLGPVLGELATVLLDEDLESTGRLSEALRSPTTLDLACTLLALDEGQDSRALVQRLPVDLGVALIQARSPGNDRWAGATGDSLRDLVAALLLSEASGQTGVEQLAPGLEDLLADTALKRRLLDTLEELSDDGHLDPLPAQLRHLADIDVAGDTRRSGEDSALLALLRLLSQSNQPMVCTIDLLVTDLEVDLGNLAVSLLQYLAGLDPGAVDSGLDLLGGVLGWGFTQDTLGAVADSGVCPALTTQLVSDLQAVDRLADPEVGDLLVVLLDLLGAVAGGGEGRLPELVDTLELAYEAELVPPLEEVLIDLGSSAIMADLTDLLPVLLDDGSLPEDSCPAGSQALYLSDAWDLGAEMLGDGDPLLTELQPLTDPVLASPSTWRVMGQAALLLQDEGSRMSSLPVVGRAVVALDPELSILSTAADMLEEQDLVRPALLLAETDGFREAAGEARAGEEGPVPFAARLVVGGTLDHLLRTVDLVLGELGD